MTYEYKCHFERTAPEKTFHKNLVFSEGSTNRNPVSRWLETSREENSRYENALAKLINKKLEAVFEAIHVL